MSESSVPKSGMASDHFANEQIGFSNTEAGSNCERAWLFGYHPETKLRPKTFGVALERGITGHKVLEHFYKELKETEDYDTSAQSAMNYLLEKRVAAVMALDEGKIEMLNHLAEILTAYFEHYKQDIEDWEILEVEEFHLLEWEGESSVYLPMRLDMVVRWKRGQWHGETSAVDHKFTNDFWDMWKLRLNSQQPLYMKALRASRFAGYPKPVVKRAVINQIRTRKVKELVPANTFKRSIIEADPVAMEKLFENHLKRAKRFERFKRMSYSQAHEETEANWGSQDCKFCFFKSLCATDLEGGDMRQIALHEYEESDYGYPTMEELRRER